jgi:hypothetical protein
MPVMFATLFGFALVDELSLYIILISVIGLWEEEEFYVNNDPWFKLIKDTLNVIKAKHWFIGDKHLYCINCSTGMKSLFVLESVAPN